MNKDAKANVVIENPKKGKQLEDSRGGSVASSYLIMASAVVSFSLFLHGVRKCKGIEEESVCVDYLLWYRACCVSVSLSSPLLTLILAAWAGN
jgi:hypothetical protein